jgi:hypothetical protein
MSVANEDPISHFAKFAKLYRLMSALVKKTKKLTAYTHQNQIMPPQTAGNNLALWKISGLTGWIGLAQRHQSTPRRS